MMVWRRKTRRTGKCLRAHLLLQKADDSWATDISPDVGIPVQLPHTHSQNLRHPFLLHVTSIPRETAKDTFACICQCVVPETSTCSQMQAKMSFAVLPGCG